MSTTDRLLSHPKKVDRPCFSQEKRRLSASTLFSSRGPAVRWLASVDYSVRLCGPGTGIREDFPHCFEFYFQGKISSDHPIGKVLSGPLFVMLLGCLTSLLGIIPVDCPSYRLICRWGVPLAAVMYLLETDLRSRTPLCRSKSIMRA